MKSIQLAVVERDKEGRDEPGGESAGIDAEIGNGEGGETCERETDVMGVGEHGQWPFDGGWEMGSRNAFIHDDDISGE